MLKRRPSKDRGRRESRMLKAHPQPRVRNKTKHTSVVTTGSPETPGLPCANGFNGFLRALPGEPGFVATIACKMSVSQA
jgi:hypothetical protein